MSLEKANYIEKHIKDFMSLSLYRFSLKLATQISLETVEFI